MMQTVGFLNEQNCIRQNNVRPDQTLDGIKNLFVVYYFIKAGEQIVGIVTFFWSDLLRETFFYRFQAASQFFCNSWRHHGNRGNHAFFLITCDLVKGKFGSHLASLYLSMQTVKCSPKRKSIAKNSLFDTIRQFNQVAVGVPNID